MAFALAFDVPLAWFFLPSDSTERVRIANDDLDATDLVELGTSSAELEQRIVDLVGELPKRDQGRYQGGVTTRRQDAVLHYRDTLKQLSELQKSFAQMADFLPSPTDQPRPKRKKS